MKRYKSKFESIEIPLEKGDSFLWGKFKNRSAVFDHIEKDNKDQDIIVTDTGKKIPLLKIRLMNEEHFSPFKAWYFPDKDEFIKFPTNKDYREYVDNYVSAMKNGAVRIHAFDSQVEVETKHNPDSKLYSKVLSTLAKKIHNFKHAVNRINWFASGDKQVFNLQEDLHLSDFVKHSGVSDFTKKFMKDRQRLKGAGNVSAKIRSLKINRKKGYITFTFISKPTYTNKTKAVDPNTLAFKNARAYEQHIRLVDFFKYAETKPGYKENELTWKEVKEIIQVCPIQVWCNCGSYEFQGMAYIDTLFDAAIYPEYRAPKRWNLYHNDDNFACKHLDILLTSGINLFIQNMTSMINKILKGNK